VGDGAGSRIGSPFEKMHGLGWAGKRIDDADGSTVGTTVAGAKMTVG